MPCQQCRAKRGLQGQDLDEAFAEEANGGVDFEVPEYYEFHRDVQEALGNELEQELEHIGYKTGGLKDAELGEHTRQSEGHRNVTPEPATGSIFVDLPSPGSSLE